MQHRIRNIAAACRTACEQYVRDRNARTFPGIECHNPDTLRGFCGIAARFLAIELRAAGFTAAVVVGNDGGHAWVEVDGLTVDITASQFLLPRVMVRKRRPAGYRPEDAAPPGVFTRRLFYGWPVGQSPTKRRVAALQRILNTNH